MIPNIDDAPAHRLRLHPRPRALSRHAERHVRTARPPEIWIYAGLVAVLALLAATRLFALGHIR
jgi:hypothetical protein